MGQDSPKEGIMRIYPETNPELILGGNLCE